VTLDEYQHQALRTAAHVRPDRDGWAMASMGLAGEAGEVVDELKKHLFHGHAYRRDALIRELGDVLWYAAVLAHLAGASLDEVATANVLKLRERYPAGFSHERSKDRGLT